MNRTRTTLLLLIACLLPLLTGCGSNEEVKHVRDLRRTGEPEKAIEYAIATLRYGSHRMDLWRELAYADLDIARREGIEGDPFKHLARAAVMCAAITEYKKKPGEDWTSARSIAVSQLSSQAVRTIGDIDDSRRPLFELQEQSEGMSVDVFSPDDDQDSPIFQYKRRTTLRPEPTMVDPDDAHRIVYTAVCYVELLALTAASADSNVVHAIRRVDESLADWPTFSDLDPTYVDDVREKARKDIGAFYSASLNDLRTYRHFTLEHLQYPDLHP